MKEKFPIKSMVPRVNYYFRDNFFLVFLKKKVIQGNEKAFQTTKKFEFFNIPTTTNDREERQLVYSITHYEIKTIWYR